MSFSAPQVSIQTLAKEAGAWQQPAAVLTFSSCWAKNYTNTVFYLEIVAFRLFFKQIPPLFVL